MADTYQIIYADPPWHYSRDNFLASHPHKSARHHYPLMGVDDIVNLDVGSITDPEGALLFLWATGPKLEQGLEVVNGWGFNFITIAFVWDKQTPVVGNYTMSTVEVCLLGKRKRIPQPRGARNVRQFLSEKRTEHSVKPAEVRSRIEAMFPTQRKIELFARTEAPGWDAWGNEVEDPAVELDLLACPVR